jgi:DNA-binding beta-propeller fold protein YncE
MSRTKRARVLVLVIAAALSAFAQKGSERSEPAPLVLTGSIPVPNVVGRIDHFAFDPENRLFLSALGNNTEEVIGLGLQRVVHTITGVPVPQGVAFSPETNKLFVGSDEGKLYIYDGTKFDLITSIEFGDDVDNLRYVAAEKRVYVGFGDGETAAIGMVDAVSNQRLPQEFKVGAHPESFQLEQSGPNIYVNVPDRKQIVSINRKSGAITHWPVPMDANFPMALDESDHRLFVATRSPARMAVFETNTGKLAAALPCVQDSDDIYYDSARKRIYVSGGEGFISVFQQRDPDHYELIRQVPTAVGARTSAYFGKLGKKGFDRLYVAVPARSQRGAEVLIYTVQD